MDTPRPHRRARMLMEIDALFRIDASPVRPIEIDPAAMDPAPDRTPQTRSAPDRSRPTGGRSFHHDRARRTPHSPPAAMPKSDRPAIESLDPPQLFTDDRPMGADLDAEQKQAELDKLRDFAQTWFEESWPDDGWQNLVFGEGDPDAELMFVGEAPGADEDRLGRPFVGRSGQLLDKQIAAMGLERSDVYIANIGKTRPPSNRVPTPKEAELTKPFLIRQIEIIEPQVLVSLGATAAKHLLDNPRIAITKMRGEWQEFAGTPLMPTFHPAYLLRQYTKENRARVWSDLQKVMKKLGLEK